MSAVDIIQPMNDRFKVQDFVVSNDHPNLVSKVKKVPLFVFQNLIYLLDMILMPVMNQFGDIVISSGYRTPELDKAVGGTGKGSHVYGMACDFVPVAYTSKDVLKWLRESNIDFRTAIIYDYKDHLHVDINDSKHRYSRNRKVLRSPKPGVYEEVV